MFHYCPCLCVPVCSAGTGGAGIILGTVAVSPVEGLGPHFSMMGSWLATYGSLGFVRLTVGHRDRTELCWGSLPLPGATSHGGIALV